MSVAFNHNSVVIILQTVSAIEEFADISSYVMIQWKVTTWMVSHERTNFKHHFIKNNQFSSISDELLKLFSLHKNILGWGECRILGVDSSIVNLT